MKKLITSILISLLSVALCSGKEMNFDSFEKCKAHVEAVLNKFNEKKVKEVFSDLGIPTDSLPEETKATMIASEVSKIVIGKVQYFEEIGSRSISDAYTKVGYFAKSKSGAWFFEVSIVKTKPNEYSVFEMSYYGNDSLKKTIAKIPESYWKHSTH